MGTTTVVDHVQCMGCHQSHTAPSGLRLLRQETITGTCLTCHAGGSTKPQGPNVGEEIVKFARHDTNPPIDVANHSPDETACSDCQEPHTMRVGKSSPPSVRTNFGEQSGVSAMDIPLPRARFEYEVCFKCHADRQEIEPRISRAILQTNWRLMFSRSAISFHPVEGRGVSPSVISLLPPQTTGSIIYCTDCHSSDTGKTAGRFGASGPHGSETPGLLIAQYDTTDYSVENANTYALCYRCHNRNSILSDQSFKSHKLHILDQKTPCSACHDPHGISSAQGTRIHNSHLINFDIRIVQKSSTGVREFNSTGMRSGNCTLKCHGVDHINFSY
jgi:predicted CXXCH cytochrome family protein